MESKIKLRVYGLSYSQIQSGAYALILAQVDGPYRLPIVIGAAEAQSIAIELENITPPRPMTHDLFESFTQAFGIRLQKVYIYKFEDGIFYSEMTFSDGTRQVTLDSRTSDAIAIALRTNSPIYTTREILLETGFIMGDDKETVTLTEDDSDDELPQPKLENMALEELQATLQNLIDEENYEEAAKVRNLIELKSKNTDADQ